MYSLWMLIPPCIGTGITPDAEYCSRDRVGEDDIIGTATIPVSAISAPGEDGECTQVIQGFEGWVVPSTAFSSGS